MVIKCIELIMMMKNNMKFFKNIILSLFLFFGSVNVLLAQESFILNYEDVDIKKVTQDIAQFSKKNNYFRPKS